MDLLLVCEKQCSKYVERELQLRNITCETEHTDHALIAKNLSEQDAIKATYLLQTPLRIIWLLQSFKASLSTESTVVNLKDVFNNLDYSFPKKTLAITCDRFGTHEYNSVDIAQEAGRLFKRYGKEKGFEAEMDLKNPQLPFFILIDDEKGFFGFDMLGKLASKRHYKVFNNPHSIKGPDAACLLMASGWTKEDSLLDPFTSGGVIPIEAALFASGRSIHFYDKTLSCKQLFSCDKIFQDIDEQIQGAPKIYAIDSYLPNITAAKKNAKLAGVEKLISFSKLDVEWLDTKLEAKSIKHIVCQPVEASKSIKESIAKRLQSDLFYQADFVGGELTFLSHRPEDLQLAAKQYKFEMISQDIFWTGQLSRWVVQFKKI